MARRDDSPPVVGEPGWRRFTPVRLLGLVVAGALAVGYLAWGTVEGPDYRIPARGTIVREDPAPPGLYAMLVVDYEVDGKQYTTHLPGSRNTGSDVEHFQPGDQVALLVAEDDPTLVYRPGGPSIGGATRIPAPLLAIGVLILGVAFVVPRRVDLSDWGRWLRMD